MARKDRCMKVLVCGGRKFFSWPAVQMELNHFHKMIHPITWIVQGGAPGADRLAKHWATVYGIPYIEYPADWKTHGPAAGMIRNRLMLDENPDIEYVIAFPGGPGTFGMIREAERRKIKVIQPLEEEPPF